jgi:NADH-quinone oxidoreductase subunit G
MPFIKIDDQELEVEKGITLLEAAKQIGIEIPHYCYHPALKIVASCRMCLVKVQGKPKLVPSCSTTVYSLPPEKKIDGKYDMVVWTQDQEVKDAQESMIEFLLLNHPVDCPECDQAGECFLQDYSYKYGKGYSRFDFEKRVPPRKDLGPQVLLIATRCILCSRCVRFTQEITGTNELIVKQRGYKSEIDTFPGVSLNNKLSLNTVDICPVGALVSKDFLHKPRNWRYEKVNTICPGCSVGCNIQVEYIPDSNQIGRIKPLYYPAVNQWWMCDDGRLFYHEYERIERLQQPEIRTVRESKVVNWQEALQFTLENLRRFKPEEIAVIGNGFATNEENFLLRQVFSEGFKVKNIGICDSFIKEEEVVYPKFTIKGEKLPNWQGAVDVLGSNLPFSKILKKVAKGEIKVLYFLGGDPRLSLEEAELKILSKLEFLAVQDIKHSPLTQLAQVVLPGASAYEKEGTFTSYQGRVQRIRPVTMPPGSARSDFEILREFAQLLGITLPLKPKSIFAQLSTQLAEYQGMDYQNLVAGGRKRAQSASGGKKAEVLD